MATLTKLSLPDLPRKPCVDETRICLLGLSTPQSQQVSRTAITRLLIWTRPLQTAAEILELSPGVGANRPREVSTWLDAEAECVPIRRAIDPVPTARQQPTMSTRHLAAPPVRSARPDYRSPRTAVWPPTSSEIPMPRLRSVLRWTAQTLFTWPRCGGRLRVHYLYRSFRSTIPFAANSRCPAGRAACISSARVWRCAGAAAGHSGVRGLAALNRTAGWRTCAILIGGAAACRSLNARAARPWRGFAWLARRWLVTPSRSSVRGGG